MSDYIKELYQSITDEAKNDSSVLDDFINNSENKFILKHNINALVSLLRFFESDENIFILNGFTGSGKSVCVDFINEFVNENILIFKNNYKEAINLDDVLLSVYKDFTDYYRENKISLPSVETTVFTDIVNTYVKDCNSKMLFVFDSFEINMRSKDTQKDILNFINWLAKYEKIKIIICSRTFKQEDLINPDSAISYMLSPISRDETEEYLASCGITGNAYEKEELYKISRGHYVLIKLAVRVMKISGVSLGIFASEYKKSGKNFLSFIISAVISFYYEKYMKPLLYLAVIRHGVSGQFLINKNFSTRDDLNFLLANNIITEKFGKYYMKDYVKKEFLKSVNYVTQIKVHKCATDIYESELPLKPFERELFLSRITMRKEIAYHKKRMEALEEEAEQSVKNRGLQGLPYLTYTKNSGYEEKIQKQEPVKKKYTEKIKAKSAINEKYNLSESDSILLNSTKVQDEVTKHFEDLSKILVPEEQEKEEEKIPEKIPDSAEEFIAIAKSYEEKYNYSAALVYYNQALNYKDEENFLEKEIEIYKRSAFCNHKINNTEEAAELYEKVYELCLKSDPKEAYNALLNVADIYNESYKFDKAKEIYAKITEAKGKESQSVKIRAYLNASDNAMNNANPESAVEYSQKALSVAEKYSDIPLLAECYFKYALLLDDLNNLDLAEKYYTKCIQTSDIPGENPCLSSAYSNLAEIAYEDGDIENAKEYFKSAAETDKKCENYEGLYYSYSKLAELYKNAYEDYEKAHSYLLKALSAAKSSEDNSYLVSVYVKTGDLYKEQKSYKKALKAYLYAQNSLTEDIPEDIVSQIKETIGELKKHTGDTEYIRLTNELKKKSNNV